ncbi:MAG: M48 family metallopeptidase [Hyphomicrobiaceae bacterium]|nr:M48 family metallopeptidase [Hyphomicrobiaceae bacterium]
MGKPRAPSATRTAAERITVRGLDEPVEVRRHPAARRMTLRVSRTRRAVIVTMPMQCDLRQAGQFLKSHLDWVRERLTSMPEPRPFAHNLLIPLRGTAHRVVFRGPLRPTDGIVSQLRTPGRRPELHVAGDDEFAPRRLRDWLITQARNDLAERVTWHCRSLGLRAGRISVRDQTSRWGSCSSTGNLSFSWRLIMAPPQILDYVAAHEVCHLAEMNHGPRFWTLVKKTCPRSDEAREWLNVYGLDLHRYGVQL